MRTRKLIKLVLCFVAAMATGFTQTQLNEKDLPVIPKPNSATFLEGSFTITPKTKITINTTSIKDLSAVFASQIGLEEPTTDKKEGKGINIILKDGYGNEAYDLKISSKGIALYGSTPKGLFYGLQTLRQLYYVGRTGGASVTLSGVEIKDKPLFGYRGFMIDTARHFLSVDEIIKMLDVMALYKLNQFHWHLTDDQGWRIEIKKYPELTGFGSKRSETLVGNPYKEGKPLEYDGKPHGGYYTSADVKKVLDHARKLYINVIPEIEMPGHASAAIAAYPELSCDGSSSKQVVKSWGVFEDIFCPTEYTFNFLTDVLNEVIAMFPDTPYIHLGGDEAPKKYWKNSTFVQEFMKKRGIKTEEQVQTYFINRMEKTVTAKGKAIIGWDEILEGDETSHQGASAEGGLSKSAIIMSWRGEKGGIEAAKKGHYAIMAPTTYHYLDYYQDDSKKEPLAIGGFLPVEKVYSYNPFSPELTAKEQKYILGVQANLWTEYINKNEQLEYMAFPRLLAVAETGWTDNERKNWLNFKHRFKANAKILDLMKVNYAKHILK